MIVKKEIKIGGMTCTSCEKIIARKLKGVEGIEYFSIDYVTALLKVEFNDDLIKFADIKDEVESAGYKCESGAKGKGSKYGLAFSAIGLLLVIYFAWTFYGSIQMPSITQGMGYGLLFVVGLLTGFHCIGMCGGFVVSYTAKGAKAGKKPLSLHTSYAIGKTLSYTIIGALFGLLGSIIAFTPKMRGVAGILAGLFLVIFGLKMLNIFPSLRKVGFRTPRFLSRFVGKERRKHSNPLVIGLLNGLMIACGPLQAIYIMAAGTGSMVEGAKLLFVFGLGTLPVMLGFGYITSFISRKSTHKILKASAYIVIILGLIMVNRGLSLTGTGYDLNTLTSGFSVAATSDSAIEMQDGKQIIRMEVNRYGWSPDKFVLKKDVPVKWIIQGKEINGCNNAIQVPSLGLKFDIKPGEQVIEFTPTKSGTIPWSCWMGMIPGVFSVQEDIGDDITGALNAVEVPKGGSCGGSGGCGCGGA
jgi:uncharacterized protein